MFPGILLAGEGWTRLDHCAGGLLKTVIRVVLWTIATKFLTEILTETHYPVIVTLTIFGAKRDDYGHSRLYVVLCPRKREWAPI